MTSCVASAPTPTPRPSELTRNGWTTPGNTASRTVARVRRQCSPDQEPGARHTNIQSIKTHKTKRPLAYINRYINSHGRPWAPSDRNPKIRPDHGQHASNSNGEASAATTDHMACRIGLSIAATPAAWWSSTQEHHSDTHRSFGQFSVTKRIETARYNHNQRAFAVAKHAANGCHPRPTTTTVRESAGSGFESLTAHHHRRSRDLRSTCLGSWFRGASVFRTAEGGEPNTVLRKRTPRPT
jgi:hypothetical protein